MCEATRRRQKATIQLLIPKKVEELYPEWSRIQIKNTKKNRAWRSEVSDPCIRKNSGCVPLVDGE
jgi:hypothetical protein